MADEAEIRAALEAEGRALAQRRITSLFDSNPRRFETFSCSADDLLLDYSKCKLREASLDHLVAFAEAIGVPAWREAMFSGEPINASENRAALHVALRDFSGRPVMVGGRDLAGEIRAMRERCYAFADAAGAGRLIGAAGKPISTIVNIGIGGSDLGPAMAVRALSPHAAKPGALRFHFVSNIDGSELADIFAGEKPETTLFIISSKTFTTIETMTNARAARAWIIETLGASAVALHFAAVSTAIDKASAFGIPEERIFGFWDFVGGRYSLWSAIGLPLMMLIGSERFDAFLRGAEAMDRQFRAAPMRQNLPVLLGLIGYWHRAICGFPTRAVIPYDQRLARFPAYLQQLDMESNGKRVRRDGAALAGPSGPIVWGEPGTNGQHAFFQLLHQGTDIVPVEFLLAAQGVDAPGLEAHHPLLVANCLAQSAALMRGRTLEEAKGDANRAFPGDRPSVTLVYPKLDPFRLGQLIALYEHRVFVEACLYGINPFDQWGVELGKELATKLEEPVKSGKDLEALDGSTAGLIRTLHGMGL